MRKGVFVAGALLVVVLVATPSARAGDDTLVRRGACTGPSDWKLVVRQETATTLRVRFAIEGGADGQTWQLFVSDDGIRVIARSKVSHDGGEVRVRKEIADLAGADTIKASGVNLVTGETCGGALTF
jgi:hypothetical protein